MTKIVKYFKSTIKILVLSSLFVIGFVGSYLAGAWLLSRIRANEAWRPDPKGTAIYVVSNGVHTDIVIPFDTLDNITNYLKSYQPFSQPKYVAYGWGDKGFYLDTPTWGDLTFSTAFRALFGLSSAAMHLTFYNNVPTEGTQVKKVLVDQKSYLRLKTYIKESFQLNNNGLPQYIGCCWYYDNKRDMFVEAKGRYTLFKTCNVWANNGLKYAGIKSAVWAPFDWCILGQFEE